ncbi:phage gp36-like protein [Hoeflea marina]|uniref:Phage gp36-like protein n=1 Tax=Hoeflea marina TaxID=274592 RepID=A0A317PFL7_9HYPH|nr:DUF1320 domain-containing protein [Hoeflea marina]PWV97712.1 phage gp36-like protein [Hoeflea marina]
MTDYATLSDMEARYPRELIVLAADEDTGQRDDARIEAALRDASSEVRGVLKARYGLDELTRLDEDSLGTLRLYTIDIALYRVAIAFSRSSERLEDRYNAAIKRLEAISAGRGGLSFINGEAGGVPAGGASSSSPNQVLIEAPARIFTRDRLRGL